MKWDKFFHWQKATIAVRNRKVYFKQLLSELDSVPSPSTILNVGSGPCRDIKEYLDEAVLTKISFECLDMDENAINYASRLLKSVFLKAEGAKVNFFCQNAFKFQPNKEYDLVWSAGLFDYLDDNQFVFLLRSLLKMVRHNKEVVIGNFSDNNPSKDYMEFGEWFLHHRNEDGLRILAEKSGCNLKSISIEKELSGVNLFLRVRKS
jgi:SAM-dependent methyltransferase